MDSHTLFDPVGPNLALEVKAIVAEPNGPLVWLFKANTNRLLLGGGGGFC